ncbi:hypothetical protein FHS96_005292 [Sphingomonas zeicaulis]|uniref:lytic transglycosylase domain-containing protein n=1 Tax=Sphingomonas zeicaulis TaxID=1632740 RepID=UPI003D19EF6C
MTEAPPAAHSDDGDHSAGSVGYRSDFRLNVIRRLSCISGADATNVGAAGTDGERLVHRSQSLPPSPLATAIGCSAIVVPPWPQPQKSGMSTNPAQPFDCLPQGYKPSGLLPFRAEARRRTYYGLMSRVACEYGVPVDLFDALIMAESRYDASALSPKRAYGLTQLMPATADSLGLDRFDVTANLRGGARYLRAQIDRFGDYHVALAAYNAGPGRIKNGRVPDITETRSYVIRIMRDWNVLARGSLPTRPYATPEILSRGVSIAIY